MTTVEAEPTILSTTTDLPPGGWGYHTLPIAQIRRDGGTQARVGLDEDTVKEYTEAMREHMWDWLGTLSRPIVCWDREGYWLADGFHRIEAGQRAGLTEYPVEVLADGKRAALLRAAGANANHGLRRTNADKRRAVELLLKDEEWGKWSDREIARRCAVSNRFVSDIRRELSVNGTQMPETRTVERSGTTYEMTPAGRSDRGAINRLDGSPLSNAPVDMIDRTQRATPPDLFAANLSLILERGGWIIILRGPGTRLTPTSYRDAEGAIAFARENLMPPTPGSEAARIMDAPWPAPPDLVVGQRADPNRPDPKEPPPTGEDHEIVATIRAKAAALGLELAWEDDQVLLYWPDEVDDLEQMDGLSYDLALEWLEGDALNIAASRAEQDAIMAAAPALAPTCEDCGSPATNKHTIGGLLAHRCDTCAAQARYDARVTDPIDAARTFLDKATAALRHWDNSALPSRREYESALHHIDALIRLLIPESEATA